MLILTGNNLGERHRDLNAKVTEAIHKKTNFDEAKSREEECDVDKLFKIDLASRYKNIDYILEVLKSGDVFHITRALKCLWIYDDEYSDFINVTYLEKNVFPYMSRKMKRKMITNISMNLRNGERAVEFYTYCKESNMTDYAFKFLVFTPKIFKLELMRDRSNFYSFRESKYLKQFIGNSIALARAYMCLYDLSSCVVYDLRYLYTVSDQEEYLDNFEIFNDVNSRYPNRSRFGIRMSRDILKKYKDRVLEQPVLYINALNKNMLIRYLTREDVKSLAPGLLPDTSDYFWSLNFYQFYKYILDKIPTIEIFAYLKQIFTSKFQGKSFELSVEFYKLRYYEMLTIEEKEEWALLHIERDADLPGIENFMWYKFVSFTKAFSGIKRYIFLTPDMEKRSRIVNVLPVTARNQDDLINMLNYYYQRHVNESEEHKESFLDKVIEHHDIYSFNNECWTSFDKLLYSLEVYSTGPTIKQGYKKKSMIYHILHNKPLPEALQEYITHTKYSIIIDYLSEERNNIVTKYLVDYYSGNIKPFTEKTSNEIDKDNHGSHECSERAQENTSLNHSKVIIYDSDKESNPTKTFTRKKTEGDFLRWLKQDIQMAVEGISEIRRNTYRWNFRLCRLFRKLKVYFPNDVGKEYLDYFLKYLADVPKGFREYRNIKMAVVGVFYLANEYFKEDFLEKYVPEDPKIDRMYLDNRILQVQKAICRLAYHSRPPFPLTSILQYIKGDYVHYCLPMFNNYLANWPSVIEFIKAVLDAPLSIQKHGLRLAFKTYSAETLKSLIVDMWKKTQNISLRKLLYQTLFNRIIKENKKVRKDLYEVLKLYTAELNHDDHDDVYSLLTSDALPYELKGDFIETAWLTVSKLSDKALDLSRKSSLISYMESNIYYVQREFPRHHIIDDHLHDMLFMKNININYDTCELQELIDAKWSITAKYIISFDNNQEEDKKKEQQRSLELMRTIMTKCIELWNHVNVNTYTIREFIYGFIKMITEKDPMISERCGYMVPIYRCILDTFQQSLKYEEIYLITWELRLTMVCRKIIHNGTYMSIKDIGNEFGKKVGRLVTRLVEKDKFYHCFYQPMADIVSKIGEFICDHYDDGYRGFNYYVSDTLTDIKMNETHAIALMMLPTDSGCRWESEHENAIRKIKKFESKEIRSFLHNKYVSSDNRVRRYIQD